MSFQIFSTATLVFECGVVKICSSLTVNKLVSNLILAPNTIKQSQILGAKCVNTLKHEAQRLLGAGGGSGVP